MKKQANKPKPKRKDMPVNFRFSTEDVENLKLFVAYGKFPSQAQAIVAITKNAAKLIKPVKYQICDPQVIDDLVIPVRETLDLLKRIHGNMHMAYLRNQLKDNHPTFIAVTQCLTDTAKRLANFEIRVAEVVDYPLNSDSHKAISEYLKAWKGAYNKRVAAKGVTEELNRELLVVETLQTLTGGIQQPDDPGIKAALEPFYAFRYCLLEFQPQNFAETKACVSPLLEINRQLKVHRAKLRAAVQVRKLNATHPSLAPLNDLLKPIPNLCDDLYTYLVKTTQFEVEGDILKQVKELLIAGLNGLNATVRTKIEEGKTITPEQQAAVDDRLLAIKTLLFYTGGIPDPAEQSKQTP